MISGAMTISAADPVVGYYIALAAILFLFGAIGAVVRRNALVMFMCVELMLNGINLLFIALARHYGSSEGHVVVFIVMAVAAAEAAVGLAIILTLFREFVSVNVDDAQTLKG